MSVVMFKALYDYLKTPTSSLSPLLSPRKLSHFLLLLYVVPYKLYHVTTYACHGNLSETEYNFGPVRQSRDENTAFMICELDNGMSRPMQESREVLYLITTYLYSSLINTISSEVV